MRRRRGDTPDHRRTGPRSGRSRREPISGSHRAVTPLHESGDGSSDDLFIAKYVPESSSVCKRVVDSLSSERDLDNSYSVSFSHVIVHLIARRRRDQCVNRFSCYDSELGHAVSRETRRTAHTPPGRSAAKLTARFRFPSPPLVLLSAASHVARLAAFDSDGSHTSELVAAQSSAGAAREVSSTGSASTSSSSSASWAARFPETSIAPKVGPMRGRP